MKGASRDKFKAAELAALQKLGRAQKLIFEMAEILRQRDLTPEDIEWFKSEAEKFQ